MSEEISTAGIEAGAGDAPVALRWTQRFRIPIAIAVLVAWVLITGWDPLHTGHRGNFIEILTERPQWGILAASMFLIVIAVICRWGDLGLNAPISAKSLLLLWLPGIYLLLFLLADVGVALAYGPPPLAVVGFLLFNTLLAGFSEEMMFRGVLFGALRTRLKPALAILITTLLFGMAHLLNAAAIGSWQLAAAQAVAAAMSGLLFIAIRVRTGSLIPAIIYHAAWDFGTLMAVSRVLTVAGPGAASAGGIGAGVGDGSLPLQLLAAPILLLLPNFLYALYLLRRRRPAPEGA